MGEQGIGAGMSRVEQDRNTKFRQTVSNGIDATVEKLNIENRGIWSPYLNGGECIINAGIRTINDKAAIFQTIA